jgi:hypothetical protein
MSVSVVLTSPMYSTAAKTLVRVYLDYLTERYHVILLQQSELQLLRSSQSVKFPTVNCGRYNVMQATLIHSTCQCGVLCTLCVLDSFVLVLF